MLRLFLLTLVVLAIATKMAEGNASLVKPIPRIKCSEKQSEGCNVRTPCVSRSSPLVNPVYFNETLQIAIYQKVAHTSKNSSNTYTIQYFPDGSDTGYQLLTFNQRDMDSKSTYSAVVPALNTFEVLMDREIVEFKDGFSYGYLQMTFDTRVDGVNISYYSCADVRLQMNKTIPVKTGAVVSIDGSISVLDPEDGSPIGNASVDQTNSTLVVPDLVAGNDPSKGNSEEVNNDEGGQGDGTEGHHGKNSAMGLHAHSNLFILLTAVSSFFLFSKVMN